jgi:hypothetical protein
MKRKDFLRRAAAFTTAAATAPLLTACGGGDADTQDTLAAAATEEAARRAKTKTTTAALTTQEALDLRFMREEEKLAHDVYTALYLKWGQPVFANIATSETDHTEAILALLVKYGLPDPAAGRAAGEFEDATLQAWYHELVQRGSVSLVEGLKVGALIEETDIRDIREKQSHTTKADILQVLDSLMCGSRNHLRAYHKQLVARGVLYQAQVLTQEEWDAIANSPSERCGG